MTQTAVIWTQLQRGGVLETNNGGRKEQLSEKTWVGVKSGMEDFTVSLAQSRFQLLNLVIHL